jgi:hypothetical protein
MDGVVMSAHCPSCKYTSIVSFTSPTDLQCFHDPIEPSDDDTDVSRPIPNEKPDVKEKTAQEHDGTSPLFRDELVVAGANGLTVVERVLPNVAGREVPLMYRTDVSGAGTLSL